MLLMFGISWEVMSCLQVKIHVTVSYFYFLQGPPLNKTPLYFGPWTSLFKEQIIFQEWTMKRNWVFATNSNFLIPISLQPDGVGLWYFKLTLFDLKEIIVWNIWGLWHCVAMILGLEKMSLWQILNSFADILKNVTKNLGLSQLNQLWILQYTGL